MPGLGSPISESISPAAVGLPSAPSCPICRATLSTCWLPLARDYVTTDRFSVWRCQACDVAMTLPQPRTLDGYYVAEYRRYNASTVAMLRWLYRRRAKRWMDRLGAPGVVLEIGCGEGWMLSALRRGGWRVVGMERTFSAARRAPGRDALPVFVGSLDAVRRDRQFDAIVLFQVLEHVTDPMEVLTRCAELLKPGGTLIVGVPNARSWQARLFGADWFHLDVPRHLFHFSPQALASALSAAGLRPHPPTFESFEHDPYGWIQSLFNRLGFGQNLLTKAMMGSTDARRSRTRTLAMTGMAALLAAPAVAAAACSWIGAAGAVMEMQATKPAQRLT